MNARFHINAYYRIKPLIPRRLQIALRRKLVKMRLSRTSSWPIDERAGEPPIGWRGWPEGKKFALVLTHDVDTARGQERCLDLMRLEKELGFRSSFNFVPERYDVSSKLRQCLVDNGFEVAVHDLNHDGKLFRERKIFLERVVQINQYLQKWNAVGFRAGAMHRNMEWMHDLDIEYDASTFDTDPFEPQPEGAGTIYPFWVRGTNGQRGYVELPYTLPQDFTLYVLMGAKNIEVWKRKLDWIIQCGGMALLNTHPDYMRFKGEVGFDEYSAEHYRDFLKYIRSNYEEHYWCTRPDGMARYWRENYRGN